MLGVRVHGVHPLRLATPFSVCSARDILPFECVGSNRSQLPPVGLVEVAQISSRRPQRLPETANLDDESLRSKLFTSEALLKLRKKTQG